MGTTVIAEGSRRVARKLRGQRASDGAGVRMTRIIGTPLLDHFDPFLLLDEFRSDDPRDYVAGFPDHPHRGFETVTYMLAGRMRHGDNQGNTGLLGPGSVQWMTAGRGIVHSEFPEQVEGLLWGFQLWVNLPAKDKMTAPRYQDIPAERIPEVELGAGVRARVIAGALGGIEGPITAVATEPLYYDLSLDAGTSHVLAVPEGHNVFVYVFEGEAEIGPDRQRVERGEIALLEHGTRIELRAPAASGARMIVVGGRPLNEPIARYGPFVMNTEEELLQAFADYHAGRL
ncbi:MAG: pirin family protein [Gammaproteobacteria bacterium]|nr:quercetin 2,3-dioxygenase [Gammaproteobacteria bacterium]